MVAREVDFPPVWLAGFAAAGLLVGRAVPVSSVVTHSTGDILVVVGLFMLACSFAQLLLARTSVMPGRVPRALVTGGVFRFSRNPSYLGQVLMLAGLYLYWSAAIALPLVVLFVAILQKRFIGPEEDQLLQRFGPECAVYKTKTRRWV